MKRRDFAAWGPTTFPVDWGIERDWSVTFEDEWYKGSGLLAAEAPETGGRIIATQFDGDALAEKPRRPIELRCSCWCGRRVVSITQRHLDEGDTGTCNHYRCHELAAMSPPRAAQFRPRNYRSRRTT